MNNYTDYLIIILIILVGYSAIIFYPVFINFNLYKSSLILSAESIITIDDKQIKKNNIIDYFQDKSIEIKQNINPPYIINNFAFIIICLISISLMIVYFFIPEYRKNFMWIIIYLSSIIGISGIIERVKKKKLYGLLIGKNSKVISLNTSDRDFSYKVYSLIINKQKGKYKGTEYTVNLCNKKIHPPYSENNTNNSAELPINLSNTINKILKLAEEIWNSNSNIDTYSNRMTAIIDIVSKIENSQRDPEFKEETKQVFREVDIERLKNEFNHHPLGILLVANLEAAIKDWQ